MGRAVHAYAPEPVLSYSVSPSLVTLFYNLTSFRSALFFALGMAPVVIPAILGISSIVRTQGWRYTLDDPNGGDIVGFVLVVLINAYSLVSTDLTLRTGWLIWPFAISLGSRWLDTIDLPQPLQRMSLLLNGGDIKGSGDGSH